MTDKFQDCERKSAIEGVDEWFEQILYTLDRAKREIENYRRNFHEACKEKEDKKSYSSKPTDVIDWAVNQTQHITSNLRVDMATVHVARLIAAGLK